jgi:hypothetical protein
MENKKYIIITIIISLVCIISGVLIGCSIIKIVRTHTCDDTACYLTSCEKIR